MELKHEQMKHNLGQGQEQVDLGDASREQGVGDVGGGRESRQLRGRGKGRVVANAGAGLRAEG